jgi:hypothetical protein
MRSTTGRRFGFQARIFMGGSLGALIFDSIAIALGWRCLDSGLSGSGHLI